LLIDRTVGRDVPQAASAQITGRSHLLGPLVMPQQQVIDFVQDHTSGLRWSHRGEEVRAKIQSPMCIDGARSQSLALDWHQGEDCAAAKRAFAARG
jgi:hypothetical protein